MSLISVFDVIGPNMVGPSSSHTAGAASVALMAQKLFQKEIKEVVSNEINDDNKKTKTKMTKKEKELMLNNIETQMKEAAKNLDFERAMELRDILFELKSN